MDRLDLAWRGFVTHSGEIVAWPALLIEHKEFHSLFYTTDKDFAARWRQWEPRGAVDIDPGAPNDSREIITNWLEHDR